MEPSLSLIFTLVSTAAATVIAVSNAIDRVRALDRTHIYIGVVAGTKVPMKLMKYPDFTSIRKARKSTSRICIIHCRTISWPARKLDFVVAELGHDPKIHGPDDPFWDSFDDDDAVYNSLK